MSELVPSFERSYAAKARRLFTALCLVTGDRFEAEEIAQEAFVRVWQRWEHVGELDDPTGYVFRVAMNVFRGRWPSGSRHRLATTLLRNVVGRNIRRIPAHLVV